MKRWLMLLALLMPTLSGCLRYAYPEINYTPEKTVPNGDGSVHVFRVDIDRTERVPEPTTTQYALWRIPIDERGIVPSQLEISPATGVYNLLNAYNNDPAPAHERSQHSLCVRVYRPGYRTVEVRQWDKAGEVQWSPASDLLAQEKAIDDLLAVPDPTARGSWWELKEQKSPPLGLLPGMESNNQKQSLLFASSEYQRLAGSPAATQPANQTVRERLQQKAIWLRRYAEQPQ